MDALRVGLLAVIALTFLIDISFGGVYERGFNSNQSYEEEHYRSKRSPQKNNGKKITKGKQQTSKGLRFEADCMTTALEWAQSCCLVPLVVPKASQKRCLQGAGKVYPGFFHTIRETYLNPLKNGKRKIDKPNDFNVKAQHFIGQPAMFAECVLKDMKLAGDDGRIDKMQMENLIAGTSKKKFLDAIWASVAPSAAQSCLQEIESLPIQQMQTPNGKQTSLLPYAFMWCLRRKLIMDCKQYTPSDGCAKAMNMLKACNPQDVWKTIQQGGPPAGSSPDEDNMSNGDTNKNNGSPTMMPGGDNNEQQPDMPPESPMAEPPAEAEAPAEAAENEPAPAEPAAEPAAEEPQPAAEEPPAEEPPAEAQPASEDAAPAEEPPAEEPPAEEPPAEEPPAEE